MRLRGGTIPQSGFEIEMRVLGPHQIPVKPRVAEQSRIEKLVSLSHCAHWQNVLWCGTNKCGRVVEWDLVLVRCQIQTSIVWYSVVQQWYSKAECGTVKVGGSAHSQSCETKSRIGSPDVGQFQFHSIYRSIVYFKTFRIQGRAPDFLENSIKQNLSVRGRPYIT